MVRPVVGDEGLDVRHDLGVAGVGFGCGIVCCRGWGEGESGLGEEDEGDG